MDDKLFGLLAENNFYVFLSYRACNLTHSEKIDIVMEIEHLLKSSPVGDKHIHLLWDKGTAYSASHIWSESCEEKVLSSDSKINLIKNSGGVSKSMLTIFYPPSQYYKTLKIH